VPALARVRALVTKLVTNLFAKRSLTSPV